LLEVLYEVLVKKILKSEHFLFYSILILDNNLWIITFNFNLFCSDGRAQRTSYLGGTDEDAESAWMWLDGTPWEYTHWREGEPNGDRGENCLLLDLDVGSHGEWIDIDCAGRGGREEGYICSYVNGEFIFQCIHVGKVGNKDYSSKI
jgi:hypothetical protein